MYALVIGRAYPDEQTGMMGIFEFEQAAALNKYGLNTVYAFCDTRSVKSLRKINYFHTKTSNVPVYGYHFPIGGAPRKIFDKLKTNRTKKLLNIIFKNHGIPDIIHIHFPLLTLNDEIWNMLKGLNKPIVVTEHWTKVQTKEIEDFRRKLLKRIVNESNTFICVGNLLKQSVLEITNVDSVIKVIPNMVKPIFYYEEKKTNKQTFDFITIGRLVEVKRFGFAIEAFTKAFKNSPNVHLHVVGDGPLFEKLKRKVNDLGMSDRVSMHGFLSREETANLIRQSDAYVSASILETFGVPFIEAMCCGKPVIGAENGPIDNYIIDNHGTLFKQDDVESLTSQFNKVYHNRNKYDGEKISKKAQEIFSEKAVAEKIIKIYNKFIN